MKIFGNNQVSLTESNQKKDSLSFRAKIPVTVVNPNNWKALSAATASLGIAGIALSRTQEEKKVSINNDEIIALINNCKKENGYDANKLIQAYQAIVRTNPQDKQSKLIIPLIRAFGNPEDWVEKYPQFAKYISNTIVDNTYSDEYVYNEVFEGLNDKSIKSENIEFYEKYLNEGYVLDNNSFLELHEKTCFLSYLPYNSDNFEHFSLEMRNRLIEQIQNMVKNNEKDEVIANFVEITKTYSEKLVNKVLNNPSKLKDIDERSLETEFQNLIALFGKIVNSDINEKERTIIMNHVLELSFYGIFDNENYQKIINCPLYREIITDKKYIPLLENFDFEQPYNTIDFKKKVAEFEKERKNKFKDCEFLDDYFEATKRDLNLLPFSKDEISEITQYLDNSKDKEFMRDILPRITWIININDKEESKKDVIRFIKQASINPEFVRNIQRKVYHPKIINSALKLAERCDDFDIIEIFINSKIPVEYLQITFDNISENNIKYILELIDSEETFDIAKFNKLLVLSDFKNPNNKSLQEIFNEIDIIQKDTKQELNARFTKNISLLLNLKELHPSTYKKIIESGYFEFLEEPNSCNFLNENADLNINIYNDLEKVKNCESIIREFNNVSLQEAFNQSNCGDVVSVDNQLYINDGNGLIKWHMSKEKYLELFPPVIRFATKQKGLGDCYLVSSLSSIMQNPKGRASLYQSFRQEGNDLYITIKAYEDYNGTVMIPEGKKPWTDDTFNNHLDGCDGLQLLEYAYAKTVFRDRRYADSAFVTENINDETLMGRIYSGEAYIAMSELLGLEFESAKTIKNLEAKSIAINRLHKSKIEKSDLENILEKYCNNENFILNFGTSLEVEANNYNISEKHAHSIIGYDKTNKIVLIENPHDCSITTKVPLNEFYKMFDDICITSLE